VGQPERREGEWSTTKGHTDTGRLGDWHEGAAGAERCICDASAAVGRQKSQTGPKHFYTPHWGPASPPSPPVQLAQCSVDSSTQPITPHFKVPWPYVIQPPHRRLANYYVAEWLLLLASCGCTCRRFLWWRLARSLTSALRAMLHTLPRL
jgi:hypothetical protein